MKFFETLRKGVKNIVTNIKKDMAERAVENKEIKEIESKAAFEERKKQAKKTAAYRVQLKGRKDRELIKHPHTLNTSYSPVMSGTSQTNQTNKKQVQQEELFDPDTAMKMVDFNPFTINKTRRQ